MTVHRDPAFAVSGCETQTKACPDCGALVTVCDHLCAIPKSGPFSDEGKALPAGSQQATPERENGPEPLLLSLEIPTNRRGLKPGLYLRLAELLDWLEWNGYGGREAVEKLNDLRGDPATERKIVLR